MSANRANVSVYDITDSKKVIGQVAMPNVFLTPVRKDLCNFVHTQMRKNQRQSYANTNESGYNSSAESWGTGRAVARIPRIAGGGTKRAGQGTFGNMCRGGGMFAPTKTYRRWTRYVPLTQRRHAVASALAASAVPSLLSAKGFRVDGLAECPLVAADSLAELTRTKDAVNFFAAMGLEDELNRCSAGIKVRAGVGKMRNRKHKRPVGPLVIIAPSQIDCVRAFNNLPGVDVTRVTDLNLLDLCPGGSPGRILVFTQSAFGMLNDIYAQKTGYAPLRSVMTNTDKHAVLSAPVVRKAFRPYQPMPARKDYIVSKKISVLVQ